MIIKCEENEFGIDTIKITKYLSGIIEGYNGLVKNQKVKYNGKIYFVKLLGGQDLKENPNCVKLSTTLYGSGDLIANIDLIKEQNK